MNSGDQALSGEDMYRIPRFGGKGVGFAGVEFSQATIFVVGFSIGFLTMGILGPTAVGFPLVGYWVNKWYLDWLRDKPMGYVKTYLYRMGWYGFSSVFDKPGKIFVGNATCGSGQRAVHDEGEF